MDRRGLAAVLLLAAGCLPGRHQVAPPPGLSGPSVPDTASTQARAWYLEGKVLMGRDDLEGAEEALQRASELDPTSPWVPVAMAEVAMRAGRYGDALTSWKLAVERDPDCGPALQRLGWATLMVGEPDEAAEWYARAIDAGQGWHSQAGLAEALLASHRGTEASEVLDAWPEPAAGRWGSRDELRRRGELNVSAGRFEQAWSDLGTYLDLEPDDPSALDLYVASAEPTRHFGRTLDHLDELGRRVPESAGIHRHTYALARQVGDAHRALAALDRWRGVEPDYPGLDLDRARLLLALDRPDEAAAALAGRATRDAASALVRARALAASGDPIAGLVVLEGITTDRVDVLRERAVLLRRLGRSDEALALIDAAAESAPESGALAVERARHAVAVGRLTAGRAALALVPGLENVDLELQWATLLWSEDRPEDALASLAGSDDPAVATLRARLLMALERPAEAVAVLQAIPPADDAPGRDMLLGHALHAAGDEGAALITWQAVAERHPDNAEALNAVGYSLAERSASSAELAEAEAMLRRALDLDPASAHIMDSLGWALFRSGRIPEAIVELERANLYEPGEPTIAGHLREARASLGEEP